MGRKTLQINNYQLSEIRDLFNSEPKYKVGMRLYAVYQLAKGIPSRKLEELYNTSFKQICTWANNFNRLGIEGLRDKPKSGRNPKLEASQMNELKNIISNQTPEDYGFNTSTWSGAIVIEIINNRWHIEYKKAQIYNIFKKLGFTFQRAKGSFPEADKDKQEVFADGIKKN